MKIYENENKNSTTESQPFSETGYIPYQARCKDAEAATHICSKVLEISKKLPEKYQQWTSSQVFF